VVVEVTIVVSDTVEVAMVEFGVGVVVLIDWLLMTELLVVVVVGADSGVVVATGSSAACTVRGSDWNMRRRLKMMTLRRLGIVVS
jgi:hypothetical protein